MENENNNPNQDQNQNNAPPQEDLAAIKAQLADELAAKAALETAAAEKDARITALETQLSEAKQASEAKDAQLTTAAAELATVKDDRDVAVGKYLGMAKALNPSIPEHVIQGASIAEIDQSIVDGKVIGTLENGKFTKVVIGSKHKLRHPLAWAIDADAFDTVIKSDATEIEVIDKEAGTRYRTPTEIFDQLKGELNRGFGRQYFLTLRHWQVEDSDNRQLSLWGGQLA